MNTFFQSKSFKIIAAVLCMLLAFILRGAYTGELVPVATRVWGLIVMPISSLGTHTTNLVENILGPLIGAYKSADENKRLTEEIRTLKEQLVDYQLIKNENIQFRQFLEIKERKSDLVFEPASVIGRSIDSPYGAFVINVGSFHGVEPRSAVITPDGLVGVITKVAYNYSEVTTILDPTLDVSCIAARTLDTGVISGDVTLSINGVSKMSFISKDSGLSVGDYVVTSGVGGLFPKNIMIGTVNKISAENSGLSLYAEVKPSAEPSTVKNVFVIKDFAGKNKNSAEK